MSRVSRDPGREYIAPVMKVRLRYAKRGRLRFSSHRDFQRAFERALRRAGVPMAYSAGFRPHPKISYANAAPTGVASEAEYIEIRLAARFDVDQLRAPILTRPCQQDWTLSTPSKSGRAISSVGWRPACGSSFYPEVTPQEGKLQWNACSPPMRSPSKG